MGSFELVHVVINHEVAEHVRVFARSLLTLVEVVHFSLIAILGPVRLGPLHQVLPGFFRTVYRVRDIANIDGEPLDSANSASPRPTDRS